MSTINISNTVVWVPVELALPVQNGIYLVTKWCGGSNYTVDFVEYKDGKWQSGYLVIAWSLMPIPYQMKEDND
ncbi:MAG: hypothetical protein K2H01_04820 [Ruminococcus sp.]|nr:hypothetical protein [Ruminococcus sp.]